MGCSNSSAGGGCRGESSKDKTEDGSSQEDKHRNYGGVYVGLPTDTTMYGSTKGAQVPAPCQSCGQSTAPGSPLPENIC